MIITERFQEEGTDVVLIRTYSDKGVLIHGGFPEGDYPEAIDPIDSQRTYTETNIPIMPEGEPQEDSYSQTLLEIIFGGTE